ncbi:hypothetical protein QF002_000929 [Paraburkholderia youngii]
MLPEHMRHEPYNETVAKRLAEIPEGPKPRDVPCPTCGAGIGRECTTRTGYGTSTHAPRWSAVGISKPSDDDRARDYWDAERRKLEAIDERFDGLHAKLSGANRGSD